MDDSPRFWILDDFPKTPNWDGWVGIVDENEGGIVVYVHEDKAHKLIALMEGM